MIADRRGRRETLCTALAGLGLFWVYLLLATNRHMAYGQDAYEFAHWIEHDHLTSINRHFLWNILLQQVYRAWSAVGLEGGAVGAGQALSAAFGAAGVVVFHRVLRACLGQLDRAGHLLLAGLYAASFACWHYAGEATPQAFSSFLRLGLLLLILRARPPIAPRRAALFGAAFGVVLLSELLGFALTFAFAALVFARSQGRQRWVNPVLFGAVSLVVFYPLYGLAMRVVLDASLEQIPLSIFWRAPRDTEFWSQLPSGVLHLLHSVVHVEGLRSPVAGLPPSFRPARLVDPAIIALILFGALTLAVGVRAAIRERRAGDGVLACALLWLAVPFLFQVKREPEALDNVFYVLPGLWLLVGLAWNAAAGTMLSRKMTASILGFVFVIMVFHNLLTAIRPNSRPTAFDMYPCASRTRRVLSPGDTLVLVSNMGNYELLGMRHLLTHVQPVHNVRLILLDGAPFRTSRLRLKLLHRSLTRLRASPPSRTLLVVIPHTEAPARGPLAPLLRTVSETRLAASTEVARLSRGILGLLSHRHDTYRLRSEGPQCGVYELR